MKNDTRINGICGLGCVYDDKAYIEQYEPDGDYGRVAEVSVYNGMFSIMRLHEDTFDCVYDVYIEEDGCLYPIAKHINGMRKALTFIDEFKAVFGKKVCKHWGEVEDAMRCMEDYRALVSEYEDAA